MAKKLRHSKVDWDSDHPRMILFADIMGFKQLLKVMPHSELVIKLRAFIKDIRKRMSPYQTAGHLRMTLFSDLVVMAVDSCTPKNFLLIVKAAAELMRECHQHDFSLNGCISCGNLVFDNPVNAEPKPNIPYMPLFVGQSVVDAYILNEDLFCYGIVLHPNAEPILQKTKMSVEETDEEIPPFSLLNIPLKKGGFAPMQYLNWSKVKLANNDVDIEAVKAATQKICEDIVPRSRAYAFNTMNLLNGL